MIADALEASGRRSTSMDLAQNAPKQVEKACQVDAESLDQAFQEWLPAPQAANLAPWPLCGTGFLL